MTSIDIDQIRAMVEGAAFYMNEEGTMFRMIHTDHDEFVAEDEDDGTDYTIPFCDITFNGFEGFYKIVKMEVPLL